MDLDAIHELAADPEYASVDVFVQHCMDDERATFTHMELRALALNCKASGSKIRADLEGYGLKLGERPAARKVRGFTANPHDRWYGPGASPSHGGSGWEQIQGFAGQRG
jgi:hypothetical protein